MTDRLSPESVYLPISALRAAGMIAPKSDVRYYLEGTLLERRGGVTRLVTTDGQMLLLQVITEADNPGEDFELILPRHFGEIRRPKKQDSQLLHLVIDWTQEPPRLTGYNNGATVEGFAIDGKYPNWRSVIPDRPSGELCFLDPRMMEVMYRAAFEVRAGPIDKDKRRFDVYQNGDGPAVLRFRTNCYVLGLVSPYREPDNADAWPTISYLKNGEGIA